MRLLYGEGIEIPKDLLLTIVDVLHALVKGRRHHFVLVKPGSSKQSSIRRVYVDDVEPGFCQ